jgi:hypothetical protein
MDGAQDFAEQTICRQHYRSKEHGFTTEVQSWISDNSLWSIVIVDTVRDIFRQTEILIFLVFSQSSILVYSFPYYAGSHLRSPYGKHSSFSSFPHAGSVLGRYW